MCINIPTEVILANIFTFHKGKVTENQFLAFVDFLRDAWPTYVWTDLCEGNLREVVEYYPTLYKLDDTGNDIVVASGDRRPNLDYFNSLYSESSRNYLEKMTEQWVAENLKSES